MTETTAGAPPKELRCLTVVSGPRRHDVVVDAHLTIGDVIELILPGAPGRVALSMAGAVLPLDQTVDDAGLPNGSMLLVTASAEPLTGPRITHVGASTIRSAGGRQETPRAVAAEELGDDAAVTVVPSGVLGGAGGRASRGAAGSPVKPTGSAPRSRIAEARAASPRRRAALAVTATVGALAGLAVLGITRGPAAGSGVVLVVGLGLFIVASAVAQAPRAERSARLVAPALGAAGGVVATAVVSEAGHVQLIGGCAGAALVALSGGTEGADRGVLRVWVSFASVIGLLALLTLVAGAPLTAVPVAALGVSVLLARVLPDLVFDVDDDVLLDIARLSVTSWSPREARRKRRGRWRIDDDAVDALVAEATLEQLAALTGLTVTVTASAVGLLLDQWQHPTWPIRLLLVTVAVGLALSARSYRRRVDRVLLRAAAAVSLVAVLLPWLKGLPAGSALALALGLVVLGVLVAILSSAMAKGYSSLGAARLADLLEAASLVAALPLVIWGIGLFDWMWRLTSH